MTLMGNQERHGAETLLSASTLAVTRAQTDRANPRATLTRSSLSGCATDRNSFSIFTVDWSPSVRNFPVAWLFDYPPIALERRSRDRAESSRFVFRRSIVRRGPNPLANEGLAGLIG